MSNTNPPNIKESLNQLKTVLNNSNSIMKTFKQNNNQFHNKLLEKIKAIIDLIQSVTNNPNIKNLHDMQYQLKKTQEQLAQAQAQLNNGNQSLKESQENINKLQKQQTDLQNQLKSSQGENGALKTELSDIRKKLQNEQSRQNDIINNIAQVNDILTQLVASINDSVAEATNYNTDYDNQINIISHKLQEVVNLLNGSNRPSIDPSTLKENEVGNPMFMTRGGKMKRNKTKGKNKRNKKGGWIYDNLSLNSSIAASSSTRKRYKHKRSRSSR